METIRQVSSLRLYEDALRLANPGISQMHARTIVYWALATYCDIDPKPLLLVLKSFGCGKTDLLETLFPMVNRGKWVEGNSLAVIRDELAGCKTAFLDEREDEGIVPEGLLTKRFKKANSKMSVNRAMGGAVFRRQTMNINGWTAVARRKRFGSVALMSRCLIIEPEFVPSPDARVTNMGDLRGVVEQLGNVEQLQGEGRTMQIWRPLAAIADKFHDGEWIHYAVNTFCSDVEEQDLTRQYEPEEAVIGALEICKNSLNATRLHDHWIKISEVKRTAGTEYEMSLKPDQVAAMLHRKGHAVSIIDGYPAVRVA